ncbi:DyP-type peroxidase [Gautieria morchelliformis]|nr:DyP-type peroxidase [Gautieria morchelliformis]
MRFTSLASVSLFAGLALQPAAIAAKENLLASPVTMPALPSADEAAQAANAASLNISDIQGDILVGMRKKAEIFYFFQINNAQKFKQGLKILAANVTSTMQLLNVSTQPNTAINVAFSQTGLQALQIRDSLGDPIFSAGQFADANNLGDPGHINWVNAFKGTSIHGFFIFASNTVDPINAEVQTVEALFGNSITKKYSLPGAARPGNQLGHEHFGFADGISQPAINGFTTNPVAGQTFIDPGHILLGQKGDVTPRPAWATGGSFLVFRQLEQLVPEFLKFLTDNPIVEPGLTAEQGSALLGARMIGRWMSGAPVDLAPKFDDPVLGADASRNSNFTYAHPGEDILSNQTRCPFSAHTRKTRPRADFNPVDIEHHMFRSGLPYGPEVSDAEAAANKTQTERGLAFISYQSNIGQGFRFQQMSWANNPDFFFGKSDPTPGFDPIVGSNHGQPRFVSGLDPTNPNRDFTLLVDFVTSRGGEYFFSPPISALSTVLSS